MLHGGTQSETHVHASTFLTEWQVMCGYGAPTVALPTHQSCGPSMHTCRWPKLAHPIVYGWKGARFDPLIMTSGLTSSIKSIAAFEDKRCWPTRAPVVDVARRGQVEQECVVWVVLLLLHDKLHTAGGRRVFMHVYVWAHVSICGPLRVA